MIKIAGLTKYYGTTAALGNINIDICEGEIIGLLGENGAGKTTMLRAIASLLPLDSGCIEIDNEKIVGFSSPKTSFMSEEGSFFPKMTAKEHAEFFSTMYNDFDSEKFYKLLGFFCVPVDKKAGVLSKGQKAKLELSIGFSKRAKYLLLDEPFLGNDMFTRRDFLRLMCDSMRENETIIIATHLIDEIENFLDRALILKNGELVENLTIDELRKNGTSLIDRVKDIYQYDESRYVRMFTE